MKNLLLFVVILITMVSGISYSTQLETTASNCMSNVQIDKLITDRKFVTFIQTVTADNKVNETMITPLYNREVIIVEYDPKIKKENRKFCVISTTNGTNVNDYTIDMLYNALERVRGHRA